MGYRPKKKILNLKFVETEWVGLEVQVKPMPMGDLMEFEDLFALSGINGISRMMAVLAENIVGWNIEDDDGNPVVADLDGIKAQDNDMVMAIIRAWQVGVSQVPAPLSEGSSSSGTSPGVPIPMTPLDSESSQSLAS